MNNTQLRNLMEAYHEVYSTDEQRVISEDADLVIGVVAESVFNLGYTAEEFIEFLNETEVDDIVEFFVDIYENNLIIESVSSNEFINEQFIALYEYGIFENVAKVAKDTITSGLQAANFAKGALTSGLKQATKGGGGFQGGIDAIGKNVTRQINRASGSLSGAIKNTPPLGANTLSKINSAVSGAKEKAKGLIKNAKAAVNNRLPGGRPNPSVGNKPPGGGPPSKPPGGSPPGGFNKSDLPKTAIAGGVGFGLGSSLFANKDNKPRRTEKLVGSANYPRLKSSPYADKYFKSANKSGGLSLGGGGTGFIAKKGDSYVIKQAKPVGADDGIVGKTARFMGLTKAKDRAAEAKRQEKSNFNRLNYLKDIELTQKNQAGYMPKGSKLGGQPTGANILKAHFEMWVDELLEEGYDLSKYTLKGLYKEYLNIISE
jgi:hypothetical protein